MRNYRYFLFDLDGTVIDTLELIIQTFQNTASIFRSCSLSRDNILKTIGLPLIEQLRILLHSMDDKESEEVIETHRNFQKKIFRDYIQLYPGVQDLFNVLHKHNKKLGIVTSRDKESTLSFLTHLNINREFSVIITKNDTTAHKPNPQPVLTGIQKLNSDCKETVFIGDSVFDIEAGKAAKVSTGFVSWGTTRVEELTSTPDYTFSSPIEILTLL
jgi:pyrophosphatase PpaX